MYSKAFVKFVKVFSVILLTGLNAECLCAPSGGTTSKSSTEAPDSSHKLGPLSPRGTSLTASSDLVVIYLPFNPNIYRICGIDLYVLMRELNNFRKNGSDHPTSQDAFASVIEVPDQKDALLGLLDTKGIPIKSSDGDAEILITEQAWNKSYIIDQYGAVLEILDQNSIPADAKIGYNLKYKWLYKLTPLGLQRLHNLMGQIFPQSRQFTTPNTVDKKP